MSSYYVPLPAAEYPRNALIDFSPIDDVIKQRRYMENQAYERAQQRENTMYERRRNALADARAQTKFDWEEQDRNLPQYEQVGNSLLEIDKRNRSARPIYTAPDPFDGIINGLTSGSPSSAPLSEGDPTFQRQSFLSDVPESSTPYFTRTGNEYTTSTPNNFRGQPTGPTAPVMPVNSQQLPPVNRTPAGPQPQPTAPPQSGVDFSKIDDATALKMMRDPRYKDLGKMILEQRMKNASGGLSKETGNLIHKDMYEASEGLAAIKGIKDTYKKEFTFWQNRLQNFGYFVARKLGQPLTPDQIKEYAQFNVWKRRTLENLNKTIQRVTGASMGVQEAGRIMATVPNLDDDDIAFESKMNDVESSLRLAMMRYRYYMNKGFFANGGNKEMMAAEMSIDQFRGLMNDRKAEIADELRMKNSNIDENTLKKEVGKRLRQEFGGAQDI